MNRLSPARARTAVCREDARWWRWNRRDYESPLHILHLEDDACDAALVESALDAGGIVCDTVRAHTREGFVAALENGGIDLVLSDFLVAGL